MIWLNKRSKSHARPETTVSTPVYADPKNRIDNQIAEYALNQCACLPDWQHVSASGQPLEYLGPSVRTRLWLAAIPQPGKESGSLVDCLYPQRSQVSPLQVSGSTSFVNTRPHKKRGWLSPPPFRVYQDRVDLRSLHADGRSSNRPARVRRYRMSRYGHSNSR